MWGPSLTRAQVCSHFWDLFRGTLYHILLSQIREFSNLQSKVLVSPKNKVVQLYPQALCTLFVISFDSLGYDRRIQPRLHVGFLPNLSRWFPLCGQVTYLIENTAMPIHAPKFDDVTAHLLCRCLMKDDVSC
jgi:hypothetical protein